MPLPTETITLLKNAKLVGPLDCNGQLLDNADPASFPAGGGGGGGGGNDTGTTTAILKGDGHHGFADAVAGVDYSTVAAVTAKEDTTAHNADISTINGQITTINTSLTGKADAAATTTALATKESITAHNSDITTINGQITTINTSLSGKADTSTMTTALAAKADTSALTAGLATKENTLPTTVNDAYVLARHNAGAGSAFFFVDPVTLGSTNASFSDGATHTNTTFTSTLAAFNSNDIGKTIVCAGNIPTATTITAVSAPNCTLSNAATTTASPLTFTILNRFVPSAGGSGTVTGVTVTNTTTPAGVNDLVTTSVNNPTTSVEIVLSKPTGTAAKTFYGNPAGAAGAASFMTQTQAFTALDITTAGKLIAQFPNQTADTFIKLTGNPTNTAAPRTPAQVLGDIGGESALTFNSPLARATNTISMPAATDAAPGHLTAADHAAFNAKLGSSRTISTTAPLTGGGDLTADRTIAMPAATDTSAGHLTAADHAAFTAKVPTTRSLTTTAPLTISTSTTPLSGPPGSDLSANRVIAMPKATASVDGYMAATDFANFAGGALNTQRITATTGTITITSSTPPVTRVTLAGTISATGFTLVLPAAANYNAAAGSPYLEIVDLAVPPAMTNFGITLAAASGEMIDGQPSIPLPRGLAYLRVNSLAPVSSRWISTKYFVDSFKDPGSLTKQAKVVFPAGTFPVTPVNLTVPTQDATWVVPSFVNTGQVVVGINGDGTVQAGNLSPSDLAPNQYEILTSGDDAPAPITSTGRIDTVRLSGAAWSGVRIYTFPNVDSYSNGETIRFYDSTGLLTNTNFVRLKSSGGYPNPNTFNGAQTIDITEPYFDRIFVADNVGHNWTVSTFGGTTSSGLAADRWNKYTSGSGQFTIVANANLVKQRARLNLINGANSLTIQNAFDGMEIEFHLRSGGASTTLALPVGSNVGGSGAGLVTLSIVAARVDKLRGTFDGNVAQWYFDPPILDYSTATPPAAPSGLTATAVAGPAINLSFTDNATNETAFDVERSTDSGTTWTANYVTLGASAGSGGTVTYADNGVTGGNRYDYRVAATNAGGSSAFSNTANATTSAATTADLIEWHFNEGSGTSSTSTVGPNAFLTYDSWTTAVYGGAAAGKAAVNLLAGLATPTAPTVVATGTGTTSYRYSIQANISDGTRSASSLNSTAVLNASVLVAGTSFNTVTLPAIGGTVLSYDVYRNFGAPIGKVGTMITTTSFVDSATSASGTAPAQSNIYTATATGSLNLGTLVTVSFWFNSAAYTNAAATPDIFRLNTTSPAIRVSYATTTMIVAMNGSGGGNLQYGYTRPAANAWHHVAVVYDRSTLTIKFYLDGSLVINPTPTFNTATGNLAFGFVTPRLGDTSCVTAVDDFRIYSTDQSANIGTIFAGGAK